MIEVGSSIKVIEDDGFVTPPFKIGGVYEVVIIDDRGYFGCYAEPNGIFWWLNPKVVEEVTE